MKVLYDPEFISKVKKANVLIRKSFREKISIFQNNPTDSTLNNHFLKRNYQGFRSIDITNDWRAIYIEKTEGLGRVAYFVALGTHDMLYSN